MRFFMFIVLVFSAANVYAQDAGSFSAPWTFTESAQPALLNQQSADKKTQPDQTQTPDPAGNPQTSTPKPSEQVPTPEEQQPQRILGIMPNFRAVSAGTIPPPPTPRQAFVIASQNTFDYSSFVFVGITSLIAEGSNTHPQLGKGLPGFWRYSWRGFVDKADGNYLVIFALPTILHEDERYYSMGTGGFWKRLTYSASRVVITPDYHGRSTFNWSEVLGRGISQGVSLAYYPSQTRTFSGFASKYAYAIGRDALTNVFREFWPDISHKVFKK